MRYRYASVILVVLIAAVAWQVQGTPEPSGPERLARGIVGWKLQHEAGRFWACGTTQGDPQAVAARWAGAIWRVAGDDINPWALAGIVANESHFDECAVGKRTREWGYARRVLRRSRLTISHTRADVLRVVRLRTQAKPGVKIDLGPAQLRYNTVYFGDPEAALSIDPGMDLVARDFRTKRRSVGRHNRLVRLRTWGAWQGHYIQSYDRRVTYLARRLGARPGEI